MMALSLDSRAAVLTAIAIPVFNTQLERSRESTDFANIRASEAEAMTVTLSSTKGTGSATTVAMTQTGTGAVEAAISSMPE